MVTQYILELLYEHNCVILPGFGGFIANRLPSKVNEVQQRVEPARKIVAFNINLVQNDGLLADAIAKGNNISFDAANVKIEHFVQQIRTEIQLKRHCAINGIGDFYLNTEEKIVFIPQADINFSKDTYGLFPITIRKIQREQELLTAKPKEDIRSKPLPLERKEKVGSRKMIYGALLITLPLVLGLFTQQSGILQKADFNIGNIFSQTIVLKNHHPAVFNPQSPFVKPTDEIEAPIETNTEPSNIAASSTDSTTQSPNNITENITPTDVHFHIIGGSFVVVENSQKFLNELQVKGYKAYIAGTNDGGLTMVSYQGFATENEALQFLLKVQQTENAQAWLLNK